MDKTKRMKSANALVEIRSREKGKHTQKQSRIALLSTLIVVYSSSSTHHHSLTFPSRPSSCALFLGRKKVPRPDRSPRGRGFAGVRGIDAGSKIAGFLVGVAGGNVVGNGLYDVGFYQKLDEGSNMSIDSVGSLQTSIDGGSAAMSVENSSVGSNNSRTGILHHTGLRLFPGSNFSLGHSVLRPGRVSHAMNEDALAQTLMDPRYPTESLENYDEWTLDLRKLNMGVAFAQGAFGKLYRGIYDGEDVAIKLLEKPENDPERALVMEQQFRQEVMMLANLKHPNIVRFIGACRKPMVWCIVTEYAKGGSVRQFLMKRQNRSVPLKLAIKQAIDIAKGMEYVHGLGLIHRDLKSDNLLIFSDKSIKIADFGVARIEVKTEGMTPETGTYRWMAPTTGHKFILIIP
ncbi:hypothetical protein ZIOFF_000754 [Zingiber officinale]|uniref:non-specific serine/threonine protein kinase n=1 Tax=Zingiber officinale TaxID=94328 RepID=A0A8J5I0W4_ZINOF|nr:hypothetical protein ZIOFF_000754 [Zingiber officinale]